MPSNAAYCTSPENFQFEPVTQDHLPMLFEWLSRPHVQPWWEPPETELGYIKDMLAERDSTRPFIFSYDGAPIGYIQYWFIGDAQKPEWIEKDPWLADLPSEAIGIDILIAEENCLSQGIGSSVLGAFVKKLRGKGFEKIIIDPDPANTRAVRAYEKAGFVVKFEHEGPEGKTLIMEFDTKRPGTLA